MNPDKQHAEDWYHVKKYNEDMFNVTGDMKYQYRVNACDRLLATIK